jgi:sugar phosphate isomerase/epimerase
MAELGSLADRFSVTIAMRSELGSFAALERTLLAADCPWFGVDLDPVAMLRDEWDMDEVFSRLGSLVRHVRGRDALLGDQRRTMPATVGQGAVDWRKLLSNLEESDYSGWITIDSIELPDRISSAVAGTRHLLEI